MNILNKALIGLSLIGLTASFSPRAEACGGCFVAVTQTTQVSGHRMILSVSPTQTTLWDQITYTGAPDSFAWVLPIKGQVDVGLSSDALFETLDQLTSARIQAPAAACPSGPPQCNATGAAASASSGSGGGVTVISEAVVGPFKTVQLAANDPTALKNWFMENSYNIPVDVQPVIDAYLAEGFGFLALKLVPGQGVDSMRPVRVTAPGASPALPLRMVAAGTGTTTPIELWVFGEGRYEPANFPSFTIKETDLVWDWDTSSSNYSEVLKAQIDAAKGKTWNIETSTPFSMFELDSLRNLAAFDAKNSGYEDPMGPSAVEACDADLNTLKAGINESSLWVTKLYAELPRSALSTDLTLGAAAVQEPAPRTLLVTKTKGTDTSCGTGPVNCDSWNTSSSGGNSAANDDGCSIRPGAGLSASIGILGLGAIASLFRRRRQTRP